MSQYTVNNSAESSNNGKAFDVWNSDTAADSRSQLLTWLSPLSPGSRHWNIQERRLNGVGEGLLETEGFKTWYAGSEGSKGGSGVLFCHGDPGVGKTFISSLVVDRLCDQTSGQNTPVSCFYLDFAARKEQSATNVLGSMLRQMVGGMEMIPGEIWRAFHQHKRTIGGRRPQLVNIVKMLRLITSSRRTFLCFDALDKCPGVERFKLLHSMKEILEQSPETRIFVTARPHIRAEVENRLAGHVTRVILSSASGDITRYIRFRLGHDEMPDAMDESLEAEILKISGYKWETFRLASLYLEVILREPTINSRQEKLSKMTDGLEWRDAYDTTIERIKAQEGGKSGLGMAALMWVSHTKTHLRADVLCQALASGLGSKDFNARNVPSISTLISCCLGLITASDERSTAEPINHTLNEYLSARPDIFSRPHATMAEICLTYLNSKLVKGLSAEPPLVIYHEPFLEYCSIYWGVHAKEEPSNHARSLALELFREYDGHISRNVLLKNVNSEDRRYYNSNYSSDNGTDFNSPSGWGVFGFSSSFSGLHCASFFGIVELVTTLIQTESYDINEQDALGYTPLAWAARNGHEKVVKVLLGRREVNPESDYPDTTPLLHAAWGGHEGVVKMLLRHRMVDPDRTDCRGRTPLSRAVSRGHEGVVKVLLGRKEVNPDRPDLDSRTPLSHACWGYRSNGIVKMLLEREEVNPDQPDDNGQTPLSHAIQCYNEEMVKMLLEREEVNPGKVDINGRTPLWHAVQWGNEGIVKMLLEREEVSPDQPDDDGRTPLSYTVQGGHEGMAKMLLEREEVSPDQPDNNGQTPLSYAVRCLFRSEGVVKILLDRKDVNPDKPDNNGQTPLSHAVRNMYGSKEVVKILLDRKEVNPDKPDNHGRTPLSHAAGHGHAGVVKILLKRGEVNPDEPDSSGQTPLSHAASRAHEGVVEMLLEREEVTPDNPDHNGRTPLLYAARNGCTGVVKLLLKRGEVNPNKPDNRGQTPLMAAPRWGSQELLKLLESHEDGTPA